MLFTHLEVGNVNRIQHRKFSFYKNEVTFSLIASKDKSLEANTFTSDSLKKNDRLLNSAVIYGANASGKSNVLLALQALSHIVLNSIKTQSGDEIIVYEPFKLDEDFLKKPTKFKIVFIYNNIQYSYKLAFNSEKIVEESLIYYPNKGRGITIFRREENKEPEFLKKDKKIQRQIFDRTLDNVLYLSNSAQQKYDKTMEVFNWFKNDLSIAIDSDSRSLIDRTIEMLNKSENTKKSIIDALNEADLGISDVTGGFKEYTFEGLFGEGKNEKRGRVYLQSKGNGKLEALEIITLHKSNDVKGLFQNQFDFLSEESEGTKRIFNLIGFFIDALNNGKTLIVDELDLRLHPLLSEYLIKMFYDPYRNDKNAQLIFTTHNVNLLDKNLFRRDQIWFTEKNPNNGTSDLYSLTEFSPRNDKNIQKGYLAGRYGALPFINY